MTISHQSEQSYLLALGHVVEYLDAAVLTLDLQDFLTVFPIEIIQATYRICSAVLFKSFLNPAIRGDFPVQMIMK